MVTFKLTGVVREAESLIPVRGLFVKAYDQEERFGDLLGVARTGGDGRFEIVSDPGDFRDFFQEKPDIHLNVFAPDNQTHLYSTERPARWSGWRVEESDVRVPRQSLDKHAPRRALRLLDGDGGEREDFDVGEALSIEVHGVRPSTVHDVTVVDEDGNRVIADRLISNSFGAIERTTVWPQAGLDLLGERLAGLERAQERWSGRALRLQVRLESAVVFERPFTFAATFRRPVLLATDSEGTPLNGFEVGEADAILTGYNIPATHRVRVLLVPRQHYWGVGDRFQPVRLRSGRMAYADADVDARGDGFRVRVARARELEPGAYDFIVRQLRYGHEDDEDFRLRPTDLVAHRSITGLVVRQEFMASKTVQGGCVNQLSMSGRSVSGPPYFQYADTFQVGENIWAALDPGALQPQHQGKMVALYLVPHKTALEWSTDKNLNHLAVLGGNTAVQTFLTQSGCINYNKRLVWPSASQIGEYDLVADFANKTADPNTFDPDDSFDAPDDIIDGYYVAGLRVVSDPTVDTSFPYAGCFKYDEMTYGSVTVLDDYGEKWDVPLRAVVCFPADGPGEGKPSGISPSGSPYPLIVVVHGNLTLYDNSYEGYNYLLEHLAKNGFIAASIYLQNDQRGTDRARVMFAHLNILKTMFGADVADNIGLMGHSRGGEAVVIAARLNHEEALGHDINAVISLAPTDQYTSENFGGAWAAPYLVIYGSMDGDLQGPENTGFALYDRASGAPKSMAFVYGAAHDPFNTIWGDFDIYYSGDVGPMDWPKVISLEAHQKVAKGYMTAFFRRHLRGDPQWDGIFRGEWVPATVAQADPGKLKIYMQYEDPTKDTIDHFEGVHTASSWQTSSIGDDVWDDDTLPVDPVEDELADIDVHSPHDTAGLLLRWDGSGDHIRFDVPGPSKDVHTFQALSFRVTQRVNSLSNPGGAQNFHVTLEDLTGKKRSVLAGKFGEIPEPHKRQYDQFTKSAMRTVRVPLHAFTIEVVATDQVDLTMIKSVTFDFGAVATGEIEIDSVEFTD